MAQSPDDNCYTVAVAFLEEELNLTGAVAVVLALDSGIFPAEQLLAPGTPIFNSFKVNAERLRHIDLRAAAAHLRDEIILPAAGEYLGLAYSRLEKERDLVQANPASLSSRTIIAAKFERYRGYLRWQGYPAQEGDEPTYIAEEEEERNPRGVIVPSPELIRSGYSMDLKRDLYEKLVGTLDARFAGAHSELVRLPSEWYANAPAAGATLFPSLDFIQYMVLAPRVMTDDILAIVTATHEWGSATAAITERKAWIKAVIEDGHREIFDGTRNYAGITPRP